MKTKKILCGVTAAVMLGTFSATAVGASAESKSVKKLLTAEFNSIDGIRAAEYLGDGYIVSQIVKDNGLDGGVRRIDVDKWRESGTFVCERAECNFETAGLVYYGDCSSAVDGNIVFFNDDAEYLAKLDKDNNTLTKVGTYEEPSRVRGLKNGYILTYAYGGAGKDLDFILISPNGNEASGGFDYEGDSKVLGIYYSDDLYSAVDSKHIFYICRQTGNSAFDDGYMGQDFEIYGVNANGTYDTLYSIKTAEGLWYSKATANAVSWVDQRRPLAPIGHIYSEDDDKVYNLGIGFSADAFDSNSNVVKNAYFKCLGSNLYGRKAVGYFASYNDKNEVTADSYALIDIDDDGSKWEGSAKVLGKSYDYMSTKDGEIYVVKNAEGKWGYIDADGNEIAFFDDAGWFIGDYAPVISNGKGYLIDRNMNKVSEEIAATDVSTYDDGLYIFTTNSGKMFVTYSNETVTVEETSEPTSSATPSDPTNSGYVEPASSAAPSKPAESNPASGIAVSALPIIAAISAVIVIKSKK